MWDFQPSECKPGSCIYVHVERRARSEASTERFGDSEVERSFRLPFEQNASRNQADPPTSQSAPHDTFKIPDLKPSAAECNAPYQLEGCYSGDRSCGRRSSSSSASLFSGMGTWCSSGLRVRCPSKPQSRTPSDSTLDPTSEFSQDYFKP